MWLIFHLGSGALGVILYSIWEKRYLDRRWCMIEGHTYEFRRWSLWIAAVILGPFLAFSLFLTARELIRVERAGKTTVARLKGYQSSKSSWGGPMV